MDIIKKMVQKREDMLHAKVPTIAFFGDSVTHGAFELFQKNEKELGNVFDEESAYPSRVKRLLSTFFPGVPINMICAGVAGDSATGALKRLERDVLSYSPNLTVVCFGLNDSCFGEGNLGNYLDALKGIFEALILKRSEVIFMTPNMMSTYVSDRVDPPGLKENAKIAMTAQNNGVLELFLEAAKALCEEYGVAVCDCYSEWKLLYEQGVDITELLANRINHPSRDMHGLFAGMLVHTMFEK